MIRPSSLSGFGFYVPEKVVSNADFAANAPITDEWIVSRTGIETRHILANGQTGTDMALAASLDALGRAARAPEDISHILYATCTPDAACPSAACVLACKLGLKGLMALDINAACTGFLNGLELARGLIALTPDALVLLVASESLSHRCNPEDYNTAVLFGDGASAVLVSAPENAAARPAFPVARVVDNLLGTDGAKGGLLRISGGFSAAPYALGDTVGPEYFIRMDGGLVYKHAVRSMTASCQEVLKRNGLSSADVDLFIPHQANLRIIEAVGARLDIPAQKCFLNVQKYGNTSSASIPLAMSEAIRSGRLVPGMSVLLASFGGGLTWGATLLRF
ncbi:MAG: ketoacyl-ACP synthase III [Deltaproteobacteria bacterium]|jgi:3-oxoacyl-[acyl-carrier-protein] synthase-3|nr:ketoacyl-ACP synthase III [Deltaproteobacteria bacterium]